ncbi:hypothetical protein P3X46_001513 [Hevea brasiliensis]|uniref:Anoctamin transmembrane domain-containing protein n=1 Tax=Hevea brasiliensis TaxID=3981 RepID=A0ABQ9NCQ0_HEVBR|nr:hypothetical protein P3X46_001513 [Hevea brasiliensis]
MDLQFKWKEVRAFVRQPDGSLFSCCKRFECYHHLLYGIVNKSKVDAMLKWDSKEYLWEVGESLMRRLESAGIAKQVFPLDVEIKGKELLRGWVLNWRNFTNHPIDDMYSYFGLKIAIYFAFLRIYTCWMLFPAVYGLIIQLVDFGSLQFLVLPVFFISIIHIIIFSSTNSLQSPLELVKNLGIDKTKEEEAHRRYERFGHLMHFRNNAMIILSYAYLVLIQYFMKIGGKISLKLIQYENNENTEYQVDSLVYKVFGLYFMQSYIGVFYHTFLRRNFLTLHQVLIQQIRKNQENQPSNVKIQLNSRVEKEYLQPSHSASIGEELEDCLFDDFLQLTLQFGMVMMFAFAFPLAFAFPAVFLIVMSICTNSALLVCLYDKEGKWKLGPGLAAILILEHILLLIKFGLSRFLPEEPAWVRANRVKNATQAQCMYSKQLWKSISSRSFSFKI